MESFPSSTKRSVGSTGPFWEPPSPQRQPLQQKERLENSQNGAGSNAFGNFKEAFSAFKEVEQKTRYVKHPQVFYKQLHDGINQLGHHDWQEAYLSLISAAQDAGLWLEPYDAQVILEDVQRKEGDELVKAVLQSSVEALNSSHSEFLSFVGAHGVRDYVIKGIH